MNRFTGSSISELQHIKQSIQDILTTPLGSRVMRRDYGSSIFELIDQPQTPSLRLQLMAAVVTALTHWEPRIKINEVEVVSGGINGALQFNLTAEHVASANRVSLEVAYG